MCEILITGAKGQLGVEFCRQLKQRAIGLGRDELDITRRDHIDATLLQYRPAVVVNCAAYTAVDRAETEAALCHDVNAHAVEYLSRACQKMGVVLVQISTDGVFGASCNPPRPWKEVDTPSPLNAYARSKLAAEAAVKQFESHFIVRTCGLFGSGRHHASFVEKMLSLAIKRTPLAVVNDQTCSPSHVADVVQATLFLLSTDQFGTYHIVNQGETTWYDYACEIFRLANMSVDVKPVASADFNAPALRPMYSVLDTSKYHRLGGPSLRSWRDALAEYLRIRTGVENYARVGF